MTPEALDNSASHAKALYSVGHSNHELSTFLDLLVRNGVEVVADVRTAPFSRYSPQYNRENLSREMRSRGIGYVFLGRELGGRPTGDEYYDADGHVRYDRLAMSDLFETGLRRLLQGARIHRVAMLCSEGDPAQCHRHLLIARVLEERGIGVSHIEPDGSICDYRSVAERTPMQRTLFDGEEESQWRSPRSVLQSTVPNHSSVD